MRCDEFSAPRFTVWEAKRAQYVGGPWSLLVVNIIQLDESMRFLKHVLERHDQEEDDD